MLTVPCRALQFLLPSLLARTFALPGQVSSHRYYSLLVRKTSANNMMCRWREDCAFHQSVKLREANGSVLC